MRKQIVFLILLFFIAFPVFSQNGLVLLLESITICEGSSTDLDNQVKIENALTIKDGWYTQEGVKLSSTIVSPIINTTYIMKSSTYGTTYENRLTVKVSPKPTAVPMNDTAVCNGKSIILRMKSFQNVDNIVWRALPYGPNIPNESAVTPSVTTNYQFTATSVNCPADPISKVVVISVNSVLDPNSLKFTIPSPVNACETCSISLNSSLIHNADSVYFSDSSWTTTTSVPVRSPITLPEGVGSNVYKGTISAKLISKNGCGIVEKTFTNLSVQVQLSAVNCIPKISTGLSDEICPCDSLILTVENPKLPECSFSYKNINISSVPLSNVHFIDSSALKTKYRFAIKPNKKTNYEFTVKYNLKSCFTQEQTKTAAFVVNMKKACQPSSNFYFCKGDTAEMAIKTSSDSHKIIEIKFEAPHTNSFRLHRFNSQIFSFHSVDTIMDTANYRKIYYTIKYQDCDSTRIVRDSVKLKENSQIYCGPTFISKSNYVGGDEVTQSIVTCKGDSIRFNINKYSSAITLKDLEVTYLPSRDERLIEISKNKYNMNFVFIAYESGILKAKIKYDFLGVPTTYDSSGINIIVKDCPPKIYVNKTFIVDCPGDSIPFYVGLKNNSTSRIHSLEWESLSTHIEQRITDTIPSTDQRYNYTAFPLSTSTLNANIVYSEGAKKESEKVQQTLRVNKACAPTAKIENTSYCIGDTLVFGLKLNNPNDSLLSVNWGGFHPYSIDSFKMVKDTLFYKTIAYKDTAYTVRITSYIKHAKRIVEYWDTLRVKIYDTPKAFLEDSIAVCSGETINLQDHENIHPKPFGVADIVYPGGISSFTPTSESWYKVEVQAAHLCAYMKGNPWFKDSVKLILDITLWLTVNSDTSICQYSPLELISRGPKNTKVTWVRNSFDTLYRNVYADFVRFDTIQGTSPIIYEAIATNACSNHSGNVEISNFTAQVAKAPLLEVYPQYRACLGDSVQLSIIKHEDFKPSSLKWSHGTEVIENLEPKFKLLTMDTLSYHLKGIGINGCPNEAWSKVFAYPLPKVQINLGDSVFCAAANSTVSTRLEASGANTYVWFPDNEVQNFINVNPTETTTYKVKGTDLNGCSHTTNFHYIIKTVPVKVFDTSVCSEKPFIFEALLMPNTSYAWVNKKGDTLSKTNTLSFASVNYTDTGIYKLLTKLQGCSNDTTVHIGITPTPKITLVHADRLLCEGSALRLSAASSMPNDHFYWELPDGNISSEETYEIPNIEYTQEGKYTFKSNYLGCSDSLSVRVSVVQKSNPTFSSNQLFYCEQDSVVLKVLTPMPDNDIYYRWQTPLRSFVTQNEQYIIYNLTKEESGALWLVVDKIVCHDSSSQVIEIRERPMPTIVSPPFFCDSMKVVLQAKDIPLDAICSWKFQGNEIGNTLTLNLEKVQQDFNGIYTFSSIVQECSSTPIDIEMIVNPLPIIQFEDTYFICQGDSLDLNVAREGGSYLWQDGSTQGQYIVTKEGWFSVKVTEKQCFTTDSVFVELRPLLQFSLGNDTVVCNDAIVELTGPTADSYLWSNGSISEKMEVVKEGRYSLMATLNECSSFDSIFIDYRFCGQLHLPTAFSPNGDGINDIFGPITSIDSDEIDFSMQIFDRNGIMVFITHKLSEKWDGTYKGKKCPLGTYLYQIKAKDKKDSVPLSKSGTVSIVG